MNDIVERAGLLGEPAPVETARRVFGEDSLVRGSKEAILAFFMENGSHFGESNLWFIVAGQPRYAGFDDFGMRSLDLPPGECLAFIEW